MIIFGSQIIYDNQYNLFEDEGNKIYKISFNLYNFILVCDISYTSSSVCGIGETIKNLGYIQ
jgi:hypothetical protein